MVRFDEDTSAGKFKLGKIICHILLILLLGQVGTKIFWQDSGRNTRLNRHLAERSNRKERVLGKENDRILLAS